MGIINFFRGLIAAAEDADEVADRYDGPCYYCHEVTNSLAGNPGLWPLQFPHADEPGKVKHHHVKCVMERLDERDLLKNDYADVAEIGRVLAVLKHYGIQAEWKEGEMLERTSPAEGVEKLAKRAKNLESALLWIDDHPEHVIGNFDHSDCCSDCKEILALLDRE